MIIYSSNELPGDGHTASPHGRSLINTEVENTVFLSLSTPTFPQLKFFFKEYKFPRF